MNHTIRGQSSPQEQLRAAGIPDTSCRVPIAQQHLGYSLCSLLEATNHSTIPKISHEYKHTHHRRNAEFPFSLTDFPQPNALEVVFAHLKCLKTVPAVTGSTDAC